MNSSYLEVNGIRFDLIVKSSKKRTSSVRLKGRDVVITLSDKLRAAERQRAFDKFVAWAEKKLKKMSTDDFVLPRYHDGGTVVTHNRIYNLNLSEGEGRRTRKSLSDAGEIEIVFAEGKMDLVLLKKSVEEIIIKDQTPYLQEVVSELNQLHFQEQYGHVRFKRVGSRFGSCSSKRNINIAFRLLFAPREVFRYVCVHELAHLREFNHSKRFWALVESAMPNYRDQEKWLKDNGFMLG